MEIKRNNDVNFEARLLVLKKKKDLKGHGFYNYLSELAKGIGDKGDIIVMSDKICQGHIDKRYYREISFDYFQPNDLEPKAGGHKMISEQVKGRFKELASTFIEYSEGLTLVKFKEDIANLLLSFTP